MPQSDKLILLIIRSVTQDCHSYERRDGEGVN